MKNEAILGFAGGYSLGVILPFVKTLRKTGYGGEIVFFHDKLTANEIQKGERKYNIKFYEISDQKPFYVNEQGFYLDNKPDVTMSPNVKRYFSYLHFVENNPDLLKIAISDTRDIIFQKNPFQDHISWDKVNFFLEDNHLIIGKSDINSNWIKRAYGSAEVDKRYNNVVSCSGYTIGGRKEMYNYLKAMTSEFENLAEQHIKLGGGIDQGVHNVLIYNQKIKDFIVHKNHENAFNIILSGTSDYLYSNGLVKNVHQETIAVVHQYDRVPVLLKKYNFRAYLKAINITAIRNKLAQII